MLTLVIGGNHEASNYLAELYYGGWLAPNIYYLGATNVVRYGPYRIAGLSGIYKRSNYFKSHKERLPFDSNEIHSVYHVRECDVSRLLQVRSPIDIGLSHDWPRRVEWFGDYKKLFADRKHFFESAKIDSLGSAAAEQVMNFLRPRYWFSGHMHIKYAATIEHKDNKGDETLKDLAISEEVLAQLPTSMFRAPFRKGKNAAKPSPPEITNTVTHFLGLDKPGPVQNFLEVLELESSLSVESSAGDTYLQRTPDGKYALHYNDEWLSIVRAEEKILVGEDESLDLKLNGLGVSGRDTNSQHLRWVQTNVTAKGLLKVPANFERHAPVYNPNDKTKAEEQPCEYPNSQTKAFCEMLNIRNRFALEEEATNEDDYIVFG